MTEPTTEQQSQPPRQQGGRRRRRLNPFLRKPLWVVLEDCGHEPFHTQTVPSSSNCGLELPQRHATDDDGNEHSEEQFTFEYEEQDHHQHQHHVSLPRHLSLFDLVSIGVGGTIGSGIFVLNGLIAHSYAGPATFLSWMIAGLAAFLSGCCYAELSGRIPSTGSSYAYAFVALGELPLKYNII